MNVNISICPETSPADLNAVAVFCVQLAIARATTDVVVVAHATPNIIDTLVATAAAAPVARKRRTKAEIAADASEIAAEIKAEIEADAAEPVAAPADVAEKAFTEAEVQALATVVARSHGPDTVKDKIAELGGARIADLDAVNLNILGAFLKSVK